jgi:hypothetical protein
MKWRLLLLLSLFIFLFSGCGVLKKSKTITVTETKIDTMILVVRDTITKIKYVALHDTAYLESEMSKAKSYYDTTLKKLRLEMTNKPFEVRVKFNKTETIKQQVKERTPNNRVYWITGFFLTCILIVLLIFHKLTK